MAKLIQYLSKWIGIPLAKELLGDFIAWLRKKFEEWKQNRKLKRDEQKVEDAKTPEEIRDAHRDRDHI